jgi:hypothetical protein
MFVLSFVVAKEFQPDHHHKAPRPDLTTLLFEDGADPADKQNLTKATDDPHSLKLP